jgi:LysM repeat protein
MKTNHTSPTKHPHWIDEEEDSTPKRKSRGRWRERVGISFPMAFAVVLGLHLTVIGGFYAYGSSKKTKAAALALKAASEKPIGPRSDALDGNDWPQPEAKPKVMAKAPPIKAPEKPALVKTGKPAIRKVAPVSAPAKSPPPAVAKAAKPAPKAVPAAPRPDAEDLKKLLLSHRGTVPAESETRRAVPVEKPAEPLWQRNPEVRAAAPVAAKPSVPSPTERPRAAVSEYTLRAGDNLYMVSRKLEVPYNELMQANGLSDPRQLRVGQKLKVPSRKTPTL